jgi:putative nucleotidyltransferase with HDIG domain
MVKEIKTRDDAYELLKEHIKTDYMIKHSIATEAIMRDLAKRLEQNVEKWGIAGLLHDLDFEETDEDPKKHTLVTEDILKGMGMDSETIHAIKAHNAEGIGIERKSVFDYALTCAESVTGLIVATALVQPDKKLSSVTSEAVIKKMKKKDFARKVSRERIKDCEGTGLTLEEFMDISVKAMQSIGSELGL